MPRAFTSENEALVRAEEDVRAELGGLDLDVRALAAVSNIFRTATVVRNHMERSVLEPHALSWSAFVVLFVLRVWGDQEAHELADEAGITTGTLTGVLKTLERKGLAQRRAHDTDGRRVIVAATAEGREVIERIMPAFNRHEALVTKDLDEAQADALAAGLRQVLRTVEDLDAGAKGTRVT
jgi:MarR family transcriptional regulator, organic hydroperoxide resistance regulator